MRVSTGIPTLDKILGGGYLPKSFNLISGSRGAGKTLYTINYLLWNAEQGKDVLYVSLEESWDSVISNLPNGMAERYAQVKKKVHYLDFGSLRPLIGREALNARTLTEAIISSIKVHQADIVALDGIAPLALVYDKERDVRSAIFEISQRLKSVGATTVFTSEETEGKISRYGVEEYVADCVAVIHYDGVKRRLQVLKIRGSEFIGGKHGFVITKKGIQVYPRILPSVEQTVKKPEEFGIKGMDELLGGKLTPGDVTMLTGPPGTGKTVIALLFAAKALTEGKKVLYISFERMPKTLISILKNMGIKIEPSNIIYVNPMDIDPYEFMWKVHRKSEGATRVVFDGINAVLMEKEEYTHMIHTLFNYLKRKGVFSLITYSTSDIISSYTLGDPYLTHISDNIINLRYAEIGSELKKILLIIRSRTGAHDRSIIEYRIGRRGVTILGKVEEMEGVISGTPRHLEIKKRVEKFFK